MIEGRPDLRCIVVEVTGGGRSERWGWEIRMVGEEELVRGVEDSGIVGTVRWD